MNKPISPRIYRENDRLSQRVLKLEAELGVAKSEAVRNLIGHRLPEKCLSTLSWIQLYRDALEGRVDGQAALALFNYCGILLDKLEVAESKNRRILALYDEWGFKDAPCPKHSKPSLLLECCALCKLEKAERKINHQKGALINADEEIAALGRERRALEPYLRHKQSCRVFCIYDERHDGCNCGLKGIRL